MTVFGRRGWVFCDPAAPAGWIEFGMAGDPLVDIRAVTYTHWNRDRPTLHEVSLQIERGTLTILVGPSGSGKSTLCDLFNGVIPHLHGGKLEGEVWVDGVNTRQTPVRELARKVGRVFQDPETMFATLYVEDEIAFGPENLRFDPMEIQETVEQLLELTQLRPYRHNLVWNLSGGQVQKLGLASVLSMHPDLIVLDEPTSNLDPGATHSVHQLILSLRAQGKTVVLVTRELDEFLAQADQLVVLERGRVLAAGPPREVVLEHGEAMLDDLGVWLPETCEVGLALHRMGRLAGGALPITVEETVDALAESGLLAGPFGRQEPGPGAAEQGELLIDGCELVYAYPEGVQALKGVSLQVRAGEMLAIVGRNGAGKSTLAKLMVGLLRPQDGELDLFGRPASSWKVQDLANHIGLVFQNPEHQFLTDKVADEIEYSLLAQGMQDAQEVRRLVEATLRQLGLEEVAELHPFALSAGLKRRLGVATMLVGSPRVLLVDEPTYGQDRHMTHTLMELMEGIRARGIAVVMITHDMRLVQEYAERVVVMSEGRILHSGSPETLFGHTELLERANLRPTMLLQLAEGLQERGIAVPGRVRRVQDLLEMLAAEGEIHG
jgi:energy-coupling factor transport system ATP-binding protein